MSAGQLLNTFEDIKTYLDSLISGDYLLKSETNFNALQGRNNLLTATELNKLANLPVITAAQVSQFVEAYDRGDWNAAIVTGFDTNDDTKLASASAVYNLKGMIDNINALLSSDDVSLDELQEIVDFIKTNQSFLDSLGIANIQGLQGALDAKLDQATASAEYARLDGSNMPFTAGLTIIEDSGPQLTLRQLTSGSNDVRIRFSRGNQDFYWDAGQLSGSGLGSDFAFQPQGGNPFVVFTNDERVGIGQVPPQSKLHVGGGDIRIDNTKSYLIEDNAGVPRAVVNMEANNNLNFRTSADTGDVILGLSSLTAAGRLFLQTAGQNRLSILSDGSVGLGTNNPTYGLDVQSTKNTVAIRAASSTAGDTLFYGTGTVTGNLNLYTTAINATGDAIANLQNSGTGGAKQAIVTSGTGDVYSEYVISGQTGYALGIDNSDGDKFKLNVGSNPSSGTNIFSASTIGEVTFPNQVTIEGSAYHSAYSEFNAFVRAKSTVGARLLQIENPTADFWWQVQTNESEEELTFVGIDSNTNYLTIGANGNSISGNTNIDGDVTIVGTNPVSFTVHPSNTQHQHQLHSNSGTNLTSYSQTSQAYAGYMITSISNDDVNSINGFGVKKGVSFGTFNNGQDVNIGNFRTTSGGGLRYYASINGDSKDHTWYGNGAEIMRLFTNGGLQVGNTAAHRWVISSDGEMSHFYAAEAYPRTYFDRDFQVAGQNGLFFGTGSASIATSGVGIARSGANAFSIYTSNGTELIERLNVDLQGDTNLSGSLTAQAGLFQSTVTIDTASDFKLKLKEETAVIDHVLTSGGFYGISGAAGYILSMNAGDQHVGVGGQLEIGSGTSDSHLKFWDDANSGYKEIKWDQGQNAFRMQDGAGAFHTIIHSGNIGNYAGATPTLLETVIAGHTITGIDADSTLQILRNFDAGALGLVMTDAEGANTFVHNTNDGSTQTWGSWRQWNGSDSWDVVTDASGKLRFDQNGTQRGIWSGGELQLTSELWATTLRATSVADSTVAFFLGERLNNPRIRYKATGFEFIDSTNTWEEIHTGSITANSDVLIYGSTSDASAAAFTIRDSGSNALFSVRNDGRFDLSGPVNVNDNLSSYGSEGVTVHGNGNWGRMRLAGPSSEIFQVGGVFGITRADFGTAANTNALMYEDANGFTLTDNTTINGLINGLTLTSSGASRQIFTHSAAGKLVLGGGTSTTNGAYIDILGDSFGSGDQIDLFASNINLKGNAAVNNLNLTGSDTNPDAILRDLNFTNNALTSSDKRAVVVRAFTQSGGGSDTRGGRLSLYTRKANQEAYNITSYNQDGSWDFPSIVNISGGDGDVILRSYNSTALVNQFRVYHSGEDVWFENQRGALYFDTPSGHNIHFRSDAQYFRNNTGGTIRAYVSGTEFVSNVPLTVNGGLEWDATTISDFDASGVSTARTVKHIDGAFQAANRPSTNYTYGFEQVSHNDNFKTQFVFDTDGKIFSRNWGGSAWTGWREVITSDTIGNYTSDNADLLDGIDSGQFARVDQSNVFAASQTVNGALTINGADVTLNGTTDTVNGFIRDYNFNNTAETAGDKRQVILRALADAGASGTRGGKFQLYTRNRDDGAFTSGFELSSVVASFYVPVGINKQLTIDSGVSEQLVLRGMETTGNNFIRFENSAATDQGYLGYASATASTLYMRNEVGDIHMSTFTGDVSFGTAGGGLNVNSTNGSYAVTRLRVDGTHRGSIYANISNQVGFLDADGSWAYRISNNSAHEWLSDNTLIATLSAAGRYTVNQVHAGGEITSSGAVLQANGFSRMQDIWIHDPANTATAHKLENSAGELRWNGHQVISSSGAINANSLSGLSQNDFIRSQTQISGTDAAVTFSSTEGITLQTNTTSSTGFPAEFGFSVHFASGAGANASSWGRNFTLWKESAISDDLYLRTYNTSDGSARPWIKLLSTANAYSELSFLRSDQDDTLTGTLTIDDPNSINLVSTTGTRIKTTGTSKVLYLQNDITGEASLLSVFTGSSDGRMNVEGSLTVNGQFKTNQTLLVESSTVGDADIVAHQQNTTIDASNKWGFSIREVGTERAAIRYRRDSSGITEFTVHTGGLEHLVGGTLRQKLTSSGVINYGTLQVTSTAYLDGVVRFGQNVWHTSEEGRERLYFSNGSHTYIKSSDRVIFRTNNTNNDSTYIDGESFIVDSPNDAAWGAYEMGAFHSSIADNANASWILTADQEDAGDIKFGIQVENTGSTMRLYAGGNFLQLNGTGISFNGTSMLSGTTSVEPSANTLPLRDSNGHLHSSWINLESDTGLSTENGAHFYHTGDAWNIRNQDAYTSYTYLRFQQNDGSDLGGVYANSGGEIGFVKTDASGWQLRVDANDNLIVSGSGLYIDANSASKRALTSGGAWLYLNPDDSFTSGTYVPGLLRADGGLQVGSGGSSFNVTSSGVVTINGNVNLGTAGLGGSGNRRLNIQSDTDSIAIALAENSGGEAFGIGVDGNGSLVLHNSTAGTLHTTFHDDGRLLTGRIDSSGHIISTSNYVYAGGARFVFGATVSNGNYLEHSSSTTKIFVGSVENTSITSSDFQHNTQVNMLDNALWFNNGSTKAYIQAHGTFGMGLYGVSQLAFRASGNTWSNPDEHGIVSEDTGGNQADDIRINSFGSVIVNLDSNSNNGSGADFIVGRHSNGGSIDELMRLNGETGDFSTSGVINVNDGAIIETVNEGGDRSSRLMLKENSTNYLYGLSLLYSGDAGASTLPSGASTLGSNAAWYLVRHDNSLNGDVIMQGSRSTNDVTFNGSITASLFNTTTADVTNALGKAAIGAWYAGTSYMMVQHRSLSTAQGNYALLQSSDGHTFVNAASGKTLYFRVNNATIMSMSTAGLTMVSGSFAGSGAGLSSLNASNLSSGTIPSARVAGDYGVRSTASGGQLYRKDDRIIEPNSISSGSLQFGFTSYNNNNAGPWADYLHMRSYTDASGGSDNLVMFSKSGIGMRIWQQSYGSSSAYSSYADVLLSTNFSTWVTKAYIDGLNVDADTLDGINSSQFVRLDTTHLGKTGSVSADTVTNTAAEWSNLPVGYSRMILSTVGTAGGAPVDNHGYFTKVANRDTGGGWGGIWVGYTAGEHYVGRTNTSGSFASWEKLWTSANDGSGSGLDADLLDGVQGSNYARTDINETFSGTVTATNFIDSSDSRLKSELDLPLGGLDLIKQLEPKLYRKGDFVESGFYADQLPEAAQYMRHKISDDYWGMDYKNLHAVEVKAIRQLSAQVESLEAEKEQLVDRVALLEEKLEMLINKLS